MQITVYLYRYWPEKSSSIHTVEMPDDATLQDLVDAVPSEHYSRVEVDRYYTVDNPSFGQGAWEIDYVIADGRVAWKPNNGDVRIRDFFHTYGIEDGSIHITTGLMGRGGGIDAEVWSHLPEILIALQIFSSGKDITEVGRAIAARIGKWRKPRTMQRLPEPVVTHTRGFFDLMLKRQRWSADELADITGVPKESVIDFLHGLRYVYDQSSRQFIASDDTGKVVEMLNTVQWHETRWDNR